MCYNAGFVERGRSMPSRGQKDRGYEEKAQHLHLLRER